MIDLFTLIYGATGLLSGLILFSNRSVLKRSKSQDKAVEEKVSVIIPARNEEARLPNLLSDLNRQTLKPYEIIVVNDGSTDKTEEIANSFKAKVINLEELPEGWIGKSWALWNGSKAAKGEILVFLDADVMLCKEGLQTLIEKFFENGKCVISVWPFHTALKLYEKLSILFNIISGLSLTSRINSEPSGLFGPCIIISKKDYDNIEGHSSVKERVLEDISLGKVLKHNGIRIRNFLGGEVVSFRMYPDGFKSLLEGWTKNFAIGSVSVGPLTFFLLFAWLWGMIEIGFKLPLSLAISRTVAPEDLIIYFLYASQLYWMSSKIGSFGVPLSVLHFIPSGFFVLVFFNSILRALFLRKVTWRGRTIATGRRKK